MTVATPPDLFAPPLFAPLLIPALPSLNLSESERALIGWLQTRAMLQRQRMETARAYYRGLQRIGSLGIAIPPSLQHLRTLVGWPAKAVDMYADRLCIDSFRLAGATDADDELRAIWVANRLDADQTLAFKDALSMGRAYFTIGSPEEPGDPPVICVESPLNMAVSWDVRYAKPKAALQTYWLDEQRHAALYLPDQTIHLGTDDKGQWVITDRDQHNFGWVPVVRMANRASSDNRDGESEIDTVVMSLTDDACRTLLNLTVASELYSVPQKYVLGATEADFQNADGTAKTAWETYITKFLGLERDDNGDLPTVGQFTPYNPAVYTNVIDSYAAQMAAHLCAPPQELGIYTQGNPPSADSVAYQLDARNKKAVQKQKSYGRDAVEVVQMAIRFQHNGDLPTKYADMVAEWVDVNPPQPGATTDAVVKQIAAGSVPATSDVTLSRLGYNAVERARLEQDRKLDIVASQLAELASSIQVKQARADLTVAKDVTPAPAGPSPTPAPVTAKPPARGRGQ